MLRKSMVLVLAMLVSLSVHAQAAELSGHEPDYSEWNRILSQYQSPDGFDYAAIRQHERPALLRLQQELARVDVDALDRNQQLAYWINLYNVNIVALIVDHYPLDSIRDLSTDLFVRLNVFKKPNVPFGNGKVSFDFIEHERIRPRFHDPRIHFAVNCGAASCPPVRHEAYVGARLDEQLDDQVRKFAEGPGVRIERNGSRVTLHTTRIMDWYGDDFDQWAGGIVEFLQPYLPDSKRTLLKKGDKVTIRFDDYDWSLNDSRR